MLIINLLISNKKIIIFLILSNVVNPNPWIALPIKQNQSIKFHKQQDKPNPIGCLVSWLLCWSSHIGTETLFQAHVGSRPSIAKFIRFSTQNFMNSMQYHLNKFFETRPTLAYLFTTWGVTQKYGIFCAQRLLWSIIKLRIVRISHLILKYPFRCYELMLELIYEESIFYLIGLN